MYSTRTVPSRDHPTRQSLPKARAVLVMATMWTTLAKTESQRTCPRV